MLRYPGVKNILCNRTNNLDFDKALEKGEITLLCTRRGDLGPNAHKAFGLFFILLMQQSILSRPGNDTTRIPHFLYIDTFPDFICKATEPIFTVYRKYKVATVLDSQNLSQLEGEGNSSNGPGKHFRDTILANCVNKIILEMLYQKTFHGGNKNYKQKENGNGKKAIKWIHQKRIMDMILKHQTLALTGYLTLKQAR